MLEKHLLSIEKEVVAAVTAGDPSLRSRYRVRTVRGDFTGCVAVGGDDKLFVVDFSGTGSTCDEMDLVFDAVLEFHRANAAAGGVDIRHIQKIRDAAERGDVREQFNLAVYYDQGRGVERDPAQATYWYRKAAEQGDPDAQYELGRHYADGLGIARDTALAEKWFLKAAEQGDARAQFELGSCHCSGKGVEKDPALAEFWFGKAVAGFRAVAGENDPDGQCGLGICYDLGKGVARDPVQARNGFARPPSRIIPKRNSIWGSVTATAKAWRGIPCRRRNGFARPPSRIIPKRNSIWGSVTATA